MSEIVELAHAKINLTLEVIGKRSDGFHNLVSVMTTIGLHDTLTVRPSDELAMADDGGIPAERNLVMRVAGLLREACGVAAGAEISLVKQIPESAGLGGGSADAAAALRALNRLWKLGLGVSELAGIGAKAGSDVPFLVHEGTALAQGRGEEVVPIPKPPLDRLLVLSPDITVPDKTKTLFSHIDRSAYTRGALSHKLAARIRAGHDCPPEFFFNVFQPLAPLAFPGWQAYYDALAGMGAREITLTGAGPSMFVVPPSKEMATAWHLLLSRARGWRSFLTEPYAPAGAAI
jgi:4-diphosphocytidyl-2-C-methyl-D-erythritol kinase